jgi:hypothetical protein
MQEASKVERQKFRERCKRLENDVQEAKLECASLTARLEASQQRANNIEEELTRVLEAAENFDAKHAQDALVTGMHRKSMERLSNECKEELHFFRVRVLGTHIFVVVAMHQFLYSLPHCSQNCPMTHVYSFPGTTFLGLGHS